jgi:hypothetical protein
VSEGKENQFQHVSCSKAERNRTSGHACPQEKKANIRICCLLKGRKKTPGPGGPEAKRKYISMSASEKRKKEGLWACMTSERKENQAVFAF